MKKESEDKVTNYCMESGLALTTVFSNYTVDDLKNMCKASGIQWIKNMSNLERILKRLDKNQSTDNKQFHKEYKKIESEYNKDVKSWQEQEKQEQEQIEMKKTEKRTKMKTKKSAKKTEDKED